MYTSKEALMPKAEEKFSRPGFKMNFAIERLQNIAEYRQMSHVKFHYMDMNDYLSGSLHKMINNINEDETITNV